MLEIYCICCKSQVRMNKEAGRGRRFGFYYKLSPSDAAPSSTSTAATEAEAPERREIESCFDCKVVQRHRATCEGCERRYQEKVARLDSQVHLTGCEMRA